MSSKIDVRHIVADHVMTLQDARTGKPSWIDFAVFFGLPLVIAIVMVRSGFRLGDTEITVLITALSVFAALLFNLLLLAHSLVTDSSTNPRLQRRRQGLKEVYANISYAILVAVSAIAFLLIHVVLVFEWVPPVTSFAVYALVTNFLLTLLLVLKRIHLMLRKEFEPPSD